jgi:hypothetical protein
MTNKTNIPLYNVDIDFDESSKAWRNNKKQISNGAFEYICGYTKPNGLPCNAPPREFHKKYRTDFKQSWGYCFKHSTT